MISFEQLRQDGKDPIATFERIFRAALEDLVPDLAETPYCVREHEVVNLFVFGHLIPKFQDEELDIRQIGIEVSIQKIRESEKEKFGRYGDIVVWPHRKATVWRTCKPLALIEWKNISCREEDSAGLERAHRRDIKFLERNASLISVGYAVLTDQKGMRVKASCKRVQNANRTRDLFAKPLGCSATYPKVEVDKLGGSFKQVRAREQACANCISQIGSRYS